MAGEKKIKVLLAKAGLDGHDRGVNVLKLGLQDEGMEVIYTGIRQTPENIAEKAVEEHVDVVGLSSLAGAHKFLFPEVVQLLREKGGRDILVIAGGMIPEEDVPFLSEMGIAAIFGPGSSIKQIADYIREKTRPKFNPKAPKPK
jgi:methylmalonyl-CoA mutase C-terminal domain/subunit